MACSQYTPGIQNERKGITVNVQDNPYSIGSILNIYSASDINEVYFIIDQIAYIDKLNPEYLKYLKKQKKHKEALEKYYEDIKDWRVRFNFVNQKLFIDNNILSFYLFFYNRINITFFNY